MTGGTLAAAALPIGTDTDVSTNGTYLYVFNQQNGSDISQSPWYEGAWATMDIVGKRDLQDWNVHKVDVVAQLPRSRDMSSPKPEVCETADVPCDTGTDIEVLKEEVNERRVEYQKWEVGTKGGFGGF